MDKESRLKRYAAHEVIADDKSIAMCVVELSGSGYVDKYFHFTEELPFTEWLGGTIEIVSNDNGKKIALWNGKRLT